MWWITVKITWFCNYYIEKAINTRVNSYNFSILADKIITFQKKRFRFRKIMVLKTQHFKELHGTCLKSAFKKAEQTTVNKEMKYWQSAYLSDKMWKMWWAYIWVVINHLHTSHPLRLLTLPLCKLPANTMRLVCDASPAPSDCSDQIQAQPDVTPTLACKGVITNNSAKEGSPAPLEEERAQLGTALTDYFLKHFLQQ